MQSCKSSHVSLLSCLNVVTTSDVVVKKLKGGGGGGALKILDRKFNRRLHCLLVVLYYSGYNRIQCRSICKIMTQ